MRLSKPDGQKERLIFQLFEQLNRSRRRLVVAVRFTIALELDDPIGQHRILPRSSRLIDALLTADYPSIGVIDAAMKNLAGPGRRIAVGFEVLRKRYEVRMRIAKVGAVVR